MSHARQVSRRVTAENYKNRQKERSDIIFAFHSDILSFLKDFVQRIIVFAPKSAQKMLILSLSLLFSSAVV